MNSQDVCVQLEQMQVMEVVTYCVGQADRENIRRVWKALSLDRTLCRPEGIKVRLVESRPGSSLSQRVTLFVEYRDTRIFATAARRLIADEIVRRIDAVVNPCYTYVESTQLMSEIDVQDENAAPYLKAA